MTTNTFSVTYDYRCPFARNAHEHVVAAKRSGVAWDVEYSPFSLTQVHVGEEGRPVWEDPGRDRDLLAIEASIVVKEHHPELFEEVHLGLFGARHDEGLDLRSREVVGAVLRSRGVEPSPVFDSIDQGWPRDAFRKAHEAAVAEYSVFGVPTFVIGTSAVFVRIMSRPGPDPTSSIEVINRVLELAAGHPELNEFKHTTIPR